MNLKTKNAFKILFWCCTLDMITTSLFLRYFGDVLFEGNQIINILNAYHPALVFAYVPMVLLVTAGFYWICRKSKLMNEGRAVVLASALMFFAAALGNALMMLWEVLL